MQIKNQRIYFRTLNNVTIYVFINKTLPKYLLSKYISNFNEKAQYIFGKILIQELGEMKEGQVEIDPTIREASAPYLLPHF